MRADAGTVVEGAAGTGVGAGTSTEEGAREGEHCERAREVERGDGGRRTEGDEQGMERGQIVY